MSKVINVEDKWKKEQIHRHRINSEGMSSLTDEQRKTLDLTFYALHEFIQEYSDMFDVTSSTARKLQDAFWSVRSNFNKEEENG